MSKSIVALLAGILGLGLFLPGCTSIDKMEFTSFGDTAAGMQMPDAVDYYPDDQLLQVAKTQFSQGNYGHAARYFEKAVEVMPNDAEAWLGLAASYDRIRRFDLADRAYRQLAKLIGGRPEYFNNVGYSYLLRGDLLKARSNFLKAYELDPSNLTTANNLALLQNSAQRPQR